MKGGSGSASQIECFNCKQKGHYSSNCLRRSGRWKSAACIKVIPDDPDGGIANTVDEVLEEPTSEGEHISVDEQVEDAEGIFQEGGLDDDEEDVGSLNNWCSHIRADKDSNSRDEEVAEVWSSAICLLPEDECPVAESLKVSKLDNGQVAYCL